MLCNPVVPIIKKCLAMIGRVRTQGTLDLILGIKKGIISTTKEIRNKYLKGGFCMENIVKNWLELKERILLSEVNGKKYILNFFEKEGIVKPYSQLKLGNTSCDIFIDRKIIDIKTGKICKHIHIQMQDLVYGI